MSEAFFRVDDDLFQTVGVFKRLLTLCFSRSSRLRGALMIVRRVEEGALK